MPPGQHDALGLHVPLVGDDDAVDPGSYRHHVMCSYVHLHYHVLYLCVYIIVAVHVYMVVDLLLFDSEESFGPDRIALHGALEAGGQ